MDFRSCGYANNRYYLQLYVGCEVLPGFANPWHFLVDDIQPGHKKETGLGKF